MTDPKATKSIGWIGDYSWARQPCNSTDNFSGKQHGVLFQTKSEAVHAGWSKPVRVEIRIRRYRHAKR